METRKEVKMKKIVFFILIGALTIGPASFVAAIEKAGIWKGERGGVECMTGGVSIGERQEMAALDGVYNLKVVTAKASGAYLGRLPVVIRDEEGRQVLEITPNGPWLYVHLPDGGYTVQAAYKGVSKARPVQLEGRRKVVMFHW
jgi:hypothetical protein